MRRTLFAATILVLCGALTARKLPALAGKPDPLMFVFLRVDPAQDVAIVRPIIAPDIGVQLDPGMKTWKPGAVLRCAAATREHAATVDGQPTNVRELILDCGGGQQLLVKGLDFSQRTK